MNVVCQLPNNFCSSWSKTQTVFCRLYLLYYLDSRFSHFSIFFQMVCFLNVICIDIEYNYKQLSDFWEPRRTSGKYFFIYFNTNNMTWLTRQVPSDQRPAFTASSEVVYVGHGTRGTDDMTWLDECPVISDQRLRPPRGSFKWDTEHGALTTWHDWLDECSVISDQRLRPPRGSFTWDKEHGALTTWHD